MRCCLVTAVRINSPSSSTRTFTKCRCITSVAIKSKASRAYIDAEGRRSRHLNVLNQSVKVPTHWTGPQHNDTNNFNRTSVGSLLMLKQGKLNDSGTREEITAGVPSGFIERFELEKYNPKHLITPQKYDEDKQRPYSTQNELNMFRLQNERLKIQENTEEYEAANPYWVDYVYSKDEHHGTGK